MLTNDGDLNFLEVNNEALFTHFRGCIKGAENPRTQFKDEHCASSHNNPTANILDLFHGES